MTIAIEVTNLYRHFPQSSRVVRAVDGVSFTVNAGEVLGIVGESGCGKSTLARLIMGLLHPSDGGVLVEGRVLAGMDRRERARLIQPYFRTRSPRSIHASVSATSSNCRSQPKVISPPRSVRTALWKSSAASVFRRKWRSAYRRSCPAASVSASPSPVRWCCSRASWCATNRPARSTSRCRRRSLNLLAELRRELNLTLLFISHNLAVVEHIASHVAVMYLGRIVEQAPSAALFRDPAHPYTQALLASVLTPEPGLGIPDVGLGQTAPDPSNIPSGCRFHPRCPKAFAACAVTTPDMHGHDRHFAECLLVADRPEPAKTAAQCLGS